MRYVTSLFETIIKSINRPNGRKLRRREKKLQRKVQTELDKQKEYIIKETNKLIKRKAKSVFGRKGVEGDIDKILDNIDNAPLEEEILIEASFVMKMGAEYRIKKGKLAKIGINFKLDHPLAVKYLEESRPLVLSKMADTTKDAIKPILVEAAKTGASYQETAKIISENFAFSKSRAQMIATNEIGHAYEEGNWIPIQDAMAEGYNVIKWWNTVKDDRVTDECKENESQGQINAKKEFRSGDDRAPRLGHPRCRCTTNYEIKT